MINNLKHIITLLLLGIAVGMTAQEIDDRLLVYGEASSSNIRVQWQPMHPPYWDSLSSIGYRIERIELNEQGSEIANSKTILAGSNSSNLLLPKDSLWFEENGAELDGLIDAMGALMYDTSFQFPENKLLNATSMRYNYLLYEMQWKPLAGEALGLMINDTIIQEGKNYRYTITGTMSDGKTLSNSIDFTTEGYTRKRNPENLYPEYDFPTKMPLSLMISAKSNKRRDQIVAQSRPYGDSIVLRWAPNSAEFWLETIETGYYIIRTEEGQLDALDTIAHVLPWAEKDFSSDIAKDEMALIAANNLYGENAKTMEGDFIEKSQLFENRYGFSLFAAERSSLAGDILGLRYVDRNVREEANYSYSISSPSANISSADANLSITNKYSLQPAPKGAIIIPEDGALSIEWALDNKYKFSSFNLERSDDGGKTFIPLEDKPLVFMETEEFPLRKFVYQDSVTNYVEYIYRLSGNDSFSETSAFTEVRGMAIDLTPPDQPSITFGRLNKARDTIHIKWRSPTITDDFVGYKVLFGASGDGPYEALTDLLPASVESFTYTGETLDGRQSHYFKVMSIDTAQNSITSIEYFVAVPDLIPPEPPVKMEGVILDDGTVQIAWEHSTSDDAVGYWLYFSNSPNTEFSGVNKELLTQNFYTYRIQEKFLNEKIYYVIATKDEAGNRSRLSEILELQRPDKVSPQKPFIEDVATGEAELILKWKKSISNDVEWYFIEKRPVGTINWVTVDSIAGDAEPVFKDPDCEIGQYYEYRICAQDDAGWYSEYPVAQKGMIPFRPSLFVIEDLTVTFDKSNQQIQLSWKYEPPQLKGWDYGYKFIIHKAFGLKNVDTFKLLESDQFTFIDTDFEAESLYKYAISIQFDNGKSGTLSPVKSVFAK